MKVEWIAPETVLILHDLQIGGHGGAEGRYNEGSLGSALALPENLATHGNPDLFDLAAAYAGAIVQKHPFVDGNKRTAFVVAVSFLDLNGQELGSDAAEAACVFKRLAAGEISEAEFAEWLRANSAPPDDTYLVPEQDQ